jgi:hypothetical protein
MIRQIIREILEEIFLVSEAIGDFNYNKTFIPPSGVVSTCKKALNDYGSQLQTAVELASGKPQSFQEIKKLRDFFRKDENKRDKKSWELHGGDAAAKWTEEAMKKFHDENMRTKKNLRNAGGAGNKKGLGIFDTSIMDPTKGRI